MVVVCRCVVLMSVDAVAFKCLTLLVLWFGACDYDLVSGFA